ncbi:MAG: hypothetical protein FWH55_09370 [Oscillospiraceae bacterium]|nr:hypothetical protein [Oscillospiraceae bacterium]
MANMLTSDIVKGYGINAGADVVGIAASVDFGLAPNGFKPSDSLEGCLSVVVFGAASPQIALLESSSVYTALRKAMIEKINGIAKNIAKRIKDDGYKSRAINGFGGKWVSVGGGKEQFGLISLKHAAELAGLGIIGTNYLLTNPEYGNLLWLGAVLTNADLVPDKKAEYAFCKNCNKCVNICPSKALDNPALFGKTACSRMFMKKVDDRWEINCYLCRKVCPYRFGAMV